MKALTPKQEKYCVLRASGTPQNAAYRQSYATKSQNENVISVNAHRLEKNTRISLRISEIQSEYKDAIKEDLRWSKELVTKNVMEVMKHCEKHMQFKMWLRCAKLLNVLHDIYPRRNRANMPPLVRVIFE